MVQKIRTFLSEVNQELSKVSWPTREELYGSVAVVIVLCVILSIFVFGIDVILNRLLGILY